MSSRIAMSFLFATVACGGSQPPSTTTAARPAQSATASVYGENASPPPYVPKPVRFENPGGMWMPHQMRAHAAKLKELGLAVDPESLADPTSSILSSVVSLGGCSASFVSAEGLIATNHHCAIGALQFNSSPKANYLRDGIVTKNRKEERSNGPTFRVYVTQKVTDITGDIRKPNLISLPDQARFKAIENAQKERVTACEKDRPGIRCSVPSFYEGGAFYLVEQMEIRDVRLVYAPPEGVGDFGGEIDNWRWPRHAGDFTLFRAYVGKDGKPADYAEENVPFKPAHHLKLASKPLEEGDLVFVAGYPARTYSLRSRAEAEEAISFFYPFRENLFTEYLALMERLGKQDPDIAIKANPLVRGFANALTNTKGQLEGLVKGGLLEKKKNQETSLAHFIEADSARKKKFGAVLPAIDASIKDFEKTREADAELKREFNFPRLLAAANTIVRMAEERAKPDALRHPDYQERNWPRLVQDQESFTRKYNRTLDTELLRLALTRWYRLTRKDSNQSATPNVAMLAIHVVDPKAVFRGAHDADEERVWYGRAADRIYAETKLEDDAVRIKLLRESTIADLQKSKDPAIRFALALRPHFKAADDREEQQNGRALKWKPQYVEALGEMTGQEPAPDANSTLRITYGTVRGYKLSPHAGACPPFTLLPQVVAKHTGKDPFIAPDRLLAAAKTTKRFGRYAESTTGFVPVDFLADLHITGGNSGSATLNARGEIVGLVFDGNYEAIASDWLFAPEMTRSIHVDIRYLLWMLDEVEGASHIVREMSAP